MVAGQRFKLVLSIHQGTFMPPILPLDAAMVFADPLFYRQRRGTAFDPKHDNHKRLDTVLFPRSSSAALPAESSLQAFTDCPVEDQSSVDAHMKAVVGLVRMSVCQVLQHFDCSCQNQTRLSSILDGCHDVLLTSIASQEPEERHAFLQFSTVCSHACKYLHCHKSELSAAQFLPDPNGITCRPAGMQKHPFTPKIQAG